MNLSHEALTPNYTLTLFLGNGCPQSALKTELFLYILGIRERLCWALDDGSADVIESHRNALNFLVRQIEEAATREAQARGWDLT